MKILTFVGTRLQFVKWEAVSKALKHICLQELTCLLEAS